MNLHAATRFVQWLVTRLISALVSLQRRLRVETRGDVPGWVLIAAMSAGLVILIWAVAGPLLTQVFEDAIARVTGNF